MPIQFHCPYCTAPIRVADSAAGKKGKCPKCATELIVPLVSPTPQAVPPVISTEGVPPIGGLDVSPPPPVATTVRSSRRRKRGGLWVPIFMFGLLIVAATFLLYEGQPKLEGTLGGERLPDFELPSGFVEPASVQLPSESVTAALEGLKERPAPVGVVSQWARIEVLPASDGRRLEVRLSKTPATEVFRVAPASHPALRQFLGANLSRFRELRNTYLAEMKTKFFRELQSAQEQNLPLDTGAWRHALVATLLEGPTGFVVEAIAGQHATRCVYEDEAGRLYFLLPQDTTSFVLRGRTMKDGTRPFPGRYTVKVAVTSPPSEPPSDVAPAEEAPTEEAAPEPPAN